MRYEKIVKTQEEAQQLSREFELLAKKLKNRDDVQAYQFNHSLPPSTIGYEHKIDGYHVFIENLPSKVVKMLNEGYHPQAHDVNIWIKINMEKVKKQ